MKNSILPILGLGLATAVVMAFAGNYVSRGNIFSGSISLDSPMMRSASISIDNPDMGVGVGSAVGQSANAGIAKMMPSQPQIYPMMGDSEALNIVDRSITKNASYSLIVNDVARYSTKIKEYVQSVNGRMLSVNSGTSNNAQYSSLYYKVPVEKFDDAVIKTTTDIKKIFSESVNAQDITGNVVNTSDSLQSLKQLRDERAVALNEAKTELEKTRLKAEISRLDSQINNLQKQVENIKAQVEYASFYVTVTNKESYFTGSALPYNIYTSEFGQAWYSMRGVFGVIIRIAIWALVYSVIWLPIVLIYKRLKRPSTKSAS